MRLPMVVGHRGARACAPENSLIGIREAVRQGARLVELDVKLTRDGVPILMHDETLASTAGVGRRVVDTDLADLAALDLLPSFLARHPEAGRAFVALHGAEPVRIPTLEQALGLAEELGVGLDLEIKPCPGRAVETAAVTIAIAHRFWPRYRSPPLLSSFTAASLEVARRTAPDWPRGLLLDRIGPDWRDQADRLDAAFIGVNAERLHPGRVAALRADSRPVLAWTVNRPARARQLWRWGVASIFSDRPALVLEGAQRVPPAAATAARAH